MGAAFDEHTPPAAEREERYARALALIGAGATARLVASGLASLAALAAVAVTFRLLGTSEYGILAFALSVVALVPDLVRLGLSAGTVREVSAADAAGDVAALSDAARGVFTATIAVGIVGAGFVFAVVFVSLDQLTVGSRVALGLGLGVVVLATQLAVASTSIALGMGRVVAGEAPHTVQSVGRLIAVSILFALAIDEVRAVAIAYALVSLVAAGVGIVQTRWILGPGSSVYRPGLSAARRLVRASVPFAVTGLAGFAIARFDVVVLGFARSSVEVGAYDPVLRAVERLLWVVPLLFMAQGFPAATRLHAAGDVSGSGDLYHHLTKLIVVLSMPAILILAAFPEVLLRMLFGVGFPSRPSLVWVLLVGFVTHLLFGMNGTFLGATGERRGLVVTGVVSLVAMVSSALILVPAYGAVGAATATAFSYVVLNVVASWALHRATGIRPFGRDLRWAMLAAVVPFAIVIGVRLTLPPGNVWQAAAWSFGAWGIWVGLLLWRGAVRPSDWRPLLRPLTVRRRGGRG